MVSTTNSIDTTELNALNLIGSGDSFRGELCAMLESAQIFSDFSAAAIQTLASYACACAVKKGATIFEEGHKRSYLCIVIDGSVDIFKESDTHERKRIATIRSGKTMGEMSILDDLPYSATAVAAEDTRVVLITKANFDNLTETYPELGLRIMRKIARLVSLRLRQTTGILLDYLE